MYTKCELLAIILQKTIDMLATLYLTDDMRNRAFAANCITAEAVELNKIVNAIAAEYADELAEEEAAEREAEPVPAWLADMIEF